MGERNHRHTASVQITQDRNVLFLGKAAWRRVRSGFWATRFLAGGDARVMGFAQLFPQLDQIDFANFLGFFLTNLWRLT